MKKAATLSAILFCGLACVLAAQEGPQLRKSPDPQSPVIPRAAEDDAPLIVSRSNLVQLPLSVVDKNGRLIDGLEKEHFQVFEDNVQQDISLFSHEDLPISMGLVIDSSLSMRPLRERVNVAALTFVKESNKADETFIVNFNSVAYLDQDFTSSIADLRDALANFDPDSTTAIYDAVYLAVDQMGKGRNDRRALLVITDGEDSSVSRAADEPNVGSKYSFTQLIEHVKASRNISIYTIGILRDEDGCGGLFKKSTCKRAKEDLMRLSELTGGQAFFPKSIEDVEDMCSMIAKELRSQYTIGYTPKNRVSDGKWRTVKVDVKAPKGTARLEARAKPGYYAAGGAASAAPSDGKKGKPR